MASVHQNDEVISENIVPSKIQWASFAYYPTPLPSPDSYNGEDWEDFDDDVNSQDCQPPLLAMMNKWYNSDEASYSSLCPEDKKHSCRRPPAIRLERKFLWRFENDSRHIPHLAMLKIQVDLQEEYNILVCARSIAALRRKAKEGQHSFVQQDVKCHDELEYLI